MSEKVNLHVGSTQDMGKRFADAWHRLEQGKKVKETHLTFFSLETMMTTLSPKRLELLKRVHQSPVQTIAELAKTLGRDYKRVHDDVSALAHAGLIVRDQDGIRAPYDSVQATVSLDATPALLPSQSSAQSSARLFEYRARDWPNVARQATRLFLADRHPW